MSRTIIHPTGISPHYDESAMTAIEYDFSEEELSQRFISQVDAVVGRKGASRFVGVAAGSLENLRRGRCKSVSAKVFNKLIAAVIRAAERKIQQLRAEQMLAMQAGDIADARKLAAALAQIETVLQERLK